MSLKNLVKAIGNLFNGVTNDAAESMKDPLMDHRLNITKTETNLEGFRNRIAQLMANNAGLERKRVMFTSESKKFDNIARSAAETGKSDDVMDAVKLKQKADGNLSELTTQISLNLAQIEKLRSTLNDGQEKLTRAKTDLTSLAARLDGAHIREDMAKAESEFMGKGGVSSLDDLRKLVEQHEDVADAQVALSVTPETSIEKRLDETYVAPVNLNAEVQKYMDAVKK